MKHRTDHFLDMVMYAVLGAVTLVTLVLAVVGIVVVAKALT